ncbi:helix-turn-helix domain-containing protein, partial [Streptomyces lydicus]
MAFPDPGTFAHQVVARCADAGPGHEAPPRRSSPPSAGRSRNDQLSAARVAAGLTQSDLADALVAHVLQATGKRCAIDADYVSRLERGLIGWPAKVTRQALESVLGVPVAALGLVNSRLGGPRRNPLSAGVSAAGRQPQRPGPPARSDRAPQITQDHPATRARHSRQLGPRRRNLGVGRANINGVAQQGDSATHIRRPQAQPSDQAATATPGTTGCGHAPLLTLAILAQLLHQQIQAQAGTAEPRSVLPDPGIPPGIPPGVPPFSSPAAPSGLAAYESDRQKPAQEVDAMAVQHRAEQAACVREAARRSSLPIECCYPPM